MKSYTDIEQSKKLAEILPHKSADMVYFGIHQGMDGKYYLSGTNTEDDVIPIYKNFCIKVFTKTTEGDVINQLPCWSLSALLDILPLNLIINNHSYAFSMVKGLNKNGETYAIKYAIFNTTYYFHLTDFYNNPVDACVAMIEKLHERNLL